MDFGRLIGHLFIMVVIVILEPKLSRYCGKFRENKKDG